MPNLDLTAAVESAARAHYAYTWSNVNGHPDVARAHWNAGRVTPGVMLYHREHVLPFVVAAAPHISAATLDAEAAKLGEDGIATRADLVGTAFDYYTEGAGQ